MPTAPKKRKKSTKRGGLLERFSPKDTDRLIWGQLVMQWVLNKKQFPESLVELKAQCRAMGFTPHIPKYIKHVMVIQNPKEILTIRLPSKALFESGRAAIEKNVGNPYPLPQFYDQFFRGTPLTKKEKLALHAARTGEYSVNGCA